MFSRRGPSIVMSMLSSENISRAVRFSSSKVRFCSVKTDIFSKNSFGGIGVPGGEMGQTGFHHIYAFEVLSLVHLEFN